VFTKELKRAWLRLASFWGVGVEKKLLIGFNQQFFELFFRVFLPPWRDAA
jgi:hypothetical protein